MLLIGLLRCHIFLCFAQTVGCKEFSPSCNQKMMMMMCVWQGKWASSISLLLQCHFLYAALIPLFLILAWNVEEVPICFHAWYLHGEDYKVQNWDTLESGLVSFLVVWKLEEDVCRFLKDLSTFFLSVKEEIQMELKLKWPQLVSLFLSWSFQENGEIVDRMQFKETLVVIEKRNIFRRNMTEKFQSKSGQW